MAITNLEKIALAITKGANNILIHPIPATPLWLVCERKKEKNWKLTLCNPFGTTYCLVSNNVTDENHLKLWEELVKLGAGVMRKTTCESSCKNHNREN